MNEKIITLRQAKAEAKEMYYCTDAKELGWTLKEYIQDYIEALEMDGYIIK